MFCTKCGKQLGDECSFCTGCGKKIEKIEKVEKEPSGIKRLESNNSEKDFSKKLSVKENIDEKEKVFRVEKSEEENFQSEKAEEKKVEKQKVKKEKSKIPFILGGIIIFIAVGIGAGAYFFYDDVMFLKYKHDLKTAININDKIEIYDEIIKVGKLDIIKKDIIQEIEKSGRDLSYYDEFKTIGKSEKEELIRDTYIYIGELESKSGNYKVAKEALEKASGYEGYNLEDDALYKEVVKKSEGDNKNYDSYYDEYYDEDYYDEEISEKGKNTEGINNNDLYIIPDSNRRYLTDSELSEYSIYELSLIRNEIYARRGYIFKEDPYVDYFNNKNWYSPVYNDANSIGLNDYEIANVEKLKKLEGLI